MPIFGVEDKKGIHYFSEVDDLRDYIQNREDKEDIPFIFTTELDKTKLN